MRRNNKGSSVVEACIVIPLFLFFMLYIVHVYRLFYVDAHIHQCLAEACVYYAERCYLEDKLVDNLSANNAGDTNNDTGGIGNDTGGTGKNVGNIGNDVVNTENNAGGADNNTGGTEFNPVLAGTAIINGQLRKYMGEDSIVNQVVVGGKNGIIVTVTPDGANRKIFLAKATYMSRIKIPMLCTFTIPCKVYIKQKAFLGYDKDEDGNTEEYVYITPNEAVYHLNRDCSHLRRTVLERAGHTGYEACGFCAKEVKSGKVYITDKGQVYHNNPKCLGLKRTINRVKKSAVSNLKPCSRCGR